MTPEIKTQPFPVACFAPPLTDALLDRYAQTITKLPGKHGELRDALSGCLKAVRLWWDLPESKGKAGDRNLQVLHRGQEKRVKVISLTDELIDTLWDAVPWPYELDAMQSLFDRIPAEEKELRDLAFHLCWHCRELTLDREPLTQDKL